MRNPKQLGFSATGRGQKRVFEGFLGLCTGSFKGLDLC